MVLFAHLGGSQPSPVCERLESKRSFTLAAFLRGASCVPQEELPPAPSTSKLWQSAAFQEDLQRCDWAAGRRARERLCFGKGSEI